MNVYDVMTVHPGVILPKAPLAEALDQMRALGCHHLPVISAEQHLIGILSFYDCQRALGDLLKGIEQPQNEKLARETCVASAMTPAPIVVEPDTSADEAARLMLEHVIGCLPVMRGETLVGIITRSDLLMAFMNLSQKSVRQPYP